MRLNESFSTATTEPHKNLSSHRNRISWMDAEATLSSPASSSLPRTGSSSAATTEAVIADSHRRSSSKQPKLPTDDSGFMTSHSSESTEEASHDELSPSGGRRTSSRRQQQQQQRQQSSNSMEQHPSPDTSGSDSNVRRHYSVSELVETLGNQRSSTELPPELERRVLDFRMAQRRRREKYGEQDRWGIFGMYAHLANVRTDLEWAEDAAWRRRHRMPYLSWSDFDQAQQSNRMRPWFTYSLILICTVTLLVEFALNDWKMEPLSVNPMFGPSVEALIKAGARETSLIVEEGQWFRLFSPLILHAGIVHYAINMLALWFIGAAVEQNHGIGNAIVLFLIPGVGGNILSAIFLPQYISVGASGGEFGLIGGCIADISLNWKLLFIKNGDDDHQTSRKNVMAILWLVLDIAINILIGLTPLVDNFTHLGGLIYGVCCGWSTIEPLAMGFFGVNATSFAKARVLLLRFFGLIVSVVSIMVTTAWLATATSANETPCGPCRYISCVPFPIFSTDKWWYCDDCDRVVADLRKTGNIYDTIDLTCPNQVIEVIDISNQTISDVNEIQKQLPSYCRKYCADVFQN